MKVIKQGSEKVYSTTCIRCHSDLEFAMSDTYMDADEIPLMTGGYSKGFTMLHIKCPVCGKSVNTEMI